MPKNSMVFLAKRASKKVCYLLVVPFLKTEAVLLTNSKENSIIIVHNHPNSSSFSSVDIGTMFDFPSISHTVATGHDGTVFVISELNCVKADFLASFNDLKQLSTNDRILIQLGNDFSFVYRKV